MSSFIYKPPWVECKACAKDKFAKENPNAMINCRAEIHTCKPLTCSIGVKFARGIEILDPLGFMLKGKTRWQRILFRLKHPLAYTNRWFWRSYRKIKSYVFSDKKIHAKPRICKLKHEIHNKFPE